MAERFRTGSRIERAVYFAALSGGFRRERIATSAGIQKYHHELSADRQRFMIRRNTHMLEKGLIMRPRRKTFATDYILATVNAFSAGTKAQPSLLSQGELTWVAEVLERYFEATASSTADEIIAARRLHSEAFQEHEVGGDGLSGPHAVSNDPPPVAVEALLALARRRKSVRWFETRPVPRDVIDTAMLVGGEAPSACNRQPFEFRMFDDPKLVRLIADVPMGTKGYAHNIPCISVIVGDLSAFSNERDRHLIYIDSCLAAMGFILALEAQGVATCCINWPDMDYTERRMRTLLNLSPHQRPVMLIAIGYPDPDGRVPYSARRSADQLRSYNRIGGVAPDEI